MGDLLWVSLNCLRPLLDSFFTAEKMHLGSLSQSSKALSFYLNPAAMLILIVYCLGLVKSE